ncbi:MAG TPA: OmpH family outer membrane protein [Vicinamibacterales bacterium]|nr:OmpH family outer membrane protein [Vicinamibacterales bacterium]
MNRIAVAVLVAGFLASGSLRAQTPPPTQTPPPATPQAPPAAAEPIAFPADAKIAFVNLQAVIQQSAFGKASSERIRKFDEEETAKLQAKNKEIEDLRAKVNTQRDLLSPDVLATMAKDIDVRTRTLQFEQEGYQVERERLNQELTGQFQLKVIPVVEEIRLARGLWMVFSVGDAGLLAAHGGLDLTAEVIKALDEAK